jgi:REP element-mobilizing transposase RayT
MPRAKREDYPGAWHHVMNRGARRAPVFIHDGDCVKFLAVVGDVVDRHGLEVHAYSLMPNHYHLLVRTPLGNLSRCIRHLNGTFTLWLNKAYEWDGPVFRGRFTSQLVEDEEYLRYLVAYIHLNPVKDHLVKRLDSFAWTSHRAYIGRDTVPEWLIVDRFLEIFGGSSKLDDFLRSVRNKSIKYPDDFNPDTGLFRKKAIEPVASTRKAVTPENAVQPLKRSVEEVLADVVRLTGESLEKLKKAEMGPRANPARRFATWALQRGADMTYKQIAKTLGMPQSQVAKLLSRLRHGEITPPLRDWIDQWLATE